jgi:hypothetical protein
MTLEKKGSIYTKSNDPFGCFIFNQTFLLCKGLNNHKGKIIYIFKNTLKCEDDMHSFPYLHHMHMNWDLRLVINNSNFIYT